MIWRLRSFLDGLDGLFLGANRAMLVLGSGKIIQVGVLAVNDQGFEPLSVGNHGGAVTSRTRGEGFGPIPVGWSSDPARIYSENMSLFHGGS